MTVYLLFSFKELMSLLTCLASLANVVLLNYYSIVYVLMCIVYTLVINPVHVLKGYNSQFMCLCICIFVVTPVLYRPCILLASAGGW